MSDVSYANRAPAPKAASEASALPSARVAGRHAAGGIGGPMPSGPPVHGLPEGALQLNPAAEAGTGALQRCDCDEAADEDEGAPGPGGFQLDTGGASPAPAATAHRAAAAGLAGASDPLPGGERIQSAFGRHDVGNVRVRIAGKAGAAARSLQANAFARGQRIGFREEPSLRLAAHEAAHTVQQRRGVQLSDGIGRPGDPYERQADAAADAVVEGRSAEGILDEDPTGNPSTEETRAVQRDCGCGGTCASCRAAAEDEDKDALQMELTVTPPPAGLVPAEEESEAESETDGETAAPVEGDAPAATDAAAEAAEEGTGTVEAPAPSPTAGPATGEAGGAAAGRPAPAAAGTTATTIAPEEDESVGRGETLDETDEESEEALQLASCGPSSEPADEEEPAEPPPGEVREDIEAEGPTPEDENADPDAVRDALAQQDPAEEIGEGTEAVDEAEPDGGEAADLAQDGGGSSEPVTPAALAPGPAMPDEIAAAIGGRAEAVAAFGAAQASLAGARTGAAGLAAMPVRFPDADGERDDLAAAEARVAAMLSHAAGGIAGMATRAEAEIVARTGTSLAAAIAGVEAAAAGARGAVAAGIASARAQVTGGAAEHRALLEGHHAITIAAVEATTAGQLARLDTVRAATEARIAIAQAAQLGPIVAAYARAEQRIRAVGADVGAEAIEIGETYYNAYRQDRRVDSGGDCIDDSWYDGCLCDRKARARMKAARDVAKGYRDSLVEEAGTQASNAAEGMPRDIGNVGEMADTARRTVETHHAATRAAIEARRDQALAASEAARAGGMAEVDATEAGTLASLDDLETRQMQNLQELEFLQIATLERTAHAAAAEALDSVALAVQAATAGVAAAAAGLTSGPPPGPDELEAALAGAEAMLDGALGALDASVSAAMAGFDGRMAEQSAASEAAIDEAAATGLDQATEMAGAATTAYAAIFAAGAQQMSDSLAATVADIEQLVSGAETAFAAIAQGLEDNYTTLIGGLDTRFEQSAEALRSAFRDALGGMRSGESSIPTKAAEAASKEKPAWQSVLKWVLIIAIIIVVAVVAGPAVIGAIGGLAGALGASAGVAGFIGATVGGAILGAATGATIQVINNVFAGDTWHQGVGRAALTGLVTGALGGAVGFGIGQAFNAGAQAGQQVARTVGSRALEFGTNLAADATMEIGQQLIETGGVDWANFGVAMAFSVGSAGLGEVPAVRNVQESISGGVSHAVSGAVSSRVRPDVSVRPDADVGARVEADATARTGEAAAPRPADVDAGPAAPRPAEPESAPAARAEADDSANPRIDEDGRIADSDLDAVAAAAVTGPAPRLDAEPDVPARARTDSELAEAAAPTRLDGEDHTLVPRRWIDGEVRLFLCTDCGPVIAKLDDMIARATDVDARDGLIQIRNEVADIETQIRNGADSAELQTRIDEISDGVRRIEVAEQFESGSVLDAGEAAAAPGRSVGDPDIVNAPPGREGTEFVSGGRGAPMSPRTTWEPPPGAAPKPPADAPMSVRRAWLEERLQMHVDEAIARFEEAGMTPRQEAALERSPNLQRAFRGSRIDEFAKATIMQDPELREIITAPDFVREPDIIDSVLPDWFDITTRRDWQRHLERYAETHGTDAGLLVAD